MMEKQYQFTLLHRAINSLDLCEVERLLSNKRTDVNHRDWKQRTALHYATRHSFQYFYQSIHHTMHLLPSPGDKKKAADTRSTTGRNQWRARHDRLKYRLIELLLLSGADVNARDYKGKTPLQFALRESDAPTIELLSERGADFDAVDKEQRSCVGYAASNEDPRVLRIVMQRLAKKQKYRGEMESSLLSYVERGMLEHVRIVCENGANPNCRDPATQDTPLIALIRRYGGLHATRRLPLTELARQEELIEALVALGADYNACDADSRAVVDVAKSSEPCLRMLLKVAVKHWYGNTEFRSRIYCEEERCKALVNRMVQEIKRLTKYQVVDGMTLAPIFYNDQAVIQKYARNRDFVRAFNRINFSRTFPMYGTNVLMRFDPAVAEYSVRRKALSAIFRILPINARIDPVAEGILEYLTLRDMSGLLMAVGAFRARMRRVENRGFDWYLRFNFKK